MKIKRAAVKIINSDTGAICWLSGFLDVDHKVPLFSHSPIYFPVRFALDYSVHLRHLYPLVKVVPVYE